MFLGVSKVLSKGRGKPAGCAKTGAKSGAKLCATNFCWGRGILREIYKRNLGL